MKATELKVGTRVRLLSDLSDGILAKAPVGREGTVIRTDRYAADVVWDGFADGHTGDGPFDNSKNHWYLYEDDAHQSWELVIEKKKTKKSVAKQIYKGNGKHEWEPVIEGTKRLRVPGGFIYTVHYSGPIFVPLPEMVHPI